MLFTCFVCRCSIFSLCCCSFEAPLAGMLTERRQTVRKQYEALQQRRALQDSTNHHQDILNPLPNLINPVSLLPNPVYPTLLLDCSQKLQLQQQIQQVPDLRPDVRSDVRLDTERHDCFCLSLSMCSYLLRFTCWVATLTSWTTKPASPNNTWSVKATQTNRSVKWSQVRWPASFSGFQQKIISKKARWFLQMNTTLTLAGFNC